MKSPAPERQVRGDALGSVQGKKAQGLIVQRRALSGEGLEWGTRGEGGEDRGELCRVGLLLLSVSKMSLEPPTLDSYFQNQSI